MQAPQQVKDTLMFTTQVGEINEPNEFIIEFYPFSTEFLSQEKPVKVIHNFDELIDFFEVD